MLSFRLEKIFNIYSNVKTLIPYCGPTIPLGSWFVQTWNSAISGSFHINLSFPGPVVLEKIFKDFPYIIICKTLIPYCGPTIPLGSWFVQTWISTISGSFHINLSFPGRVVLEKKIFKDFSNIIICKTLIPYCGPIVPPGVMIWTNLNLHYIRKLPYKFQLSWPSGSWEEDF